MGKRYILDTNVVSKIVDGSYSEKILDFIRKEVFLEEVKLLVITQIELLGHTPLDLRTAIVLKSFVDNSIILPLDDEVILKTIEIRKKAKIKLPDAIIAATAIVHNLILPSNNDSDFLKVPKLKYLNPAKMLNYEFNLRRR